MKSKTVAVYEVLHDIDGDGLAYDGTAIARFRNAADALVFANAHTCYGRPAKAQAIDVPKHISQCIFELERVSR